MSGWISSKLRVAETLLQQIDQQAAESLRKNEGSRSDGNLSGDHNAVPKKPSDILPPLKDQLLKKKRIPPENSDFVGKLRNDGVRGVEGNEGEGGSVSINPKSSLTDSDWTELLGAPSKARNGGNGGVPRVHGLRKDGDGKRQRGSGSKFSPLEMKRSQNVVNGKSQKSDIVQEGKVNGDRSDGNRSSGSDSMRSSVESQGVADNSDGSEMVGEDRSGSLAVDNVNRVTDGKTKDVLASAPDGVSYLKDEKGIPEMQPSAVIQVTDSNLGVNKDRNRLNSGVTPDNNINGATKISSTSTGSLLPSDGESYSETDSDSTSDSEAEREREERRKRREQILAQKAAAKAIEAIKDRENLIARLEGEKQSLEKIIEERAKQQAQEATELQTTMMETMEAVDLEKQKHNNTRMEALTRLAKLETTNAELARSLATAQWNLEVEVKRVGELRREIELKEARHEELTSKKNSHQSGNKLTASKGVEFEHEILEAELTFLTDKVGRLQEKAKTLETSIETTRKEMENPTEVEIELKRRLGQLTDHLIQKQAQVEALSSEKAMLIFRIEAVSRLLEENTSILNASDHPTGDLESGIWDLSNSRLKPLLEERLRKGQKHIGSLVRQLDSIFSTGATFLRRNQTARMWSFFYLICLHLWVLYILKSHSPVSEEDISGAVVSLENINNTRGS